MSTDNDPPNSECQSGEPVLTDWNDFDNPDTAVVERVSERTGRAVTDLPILQAAVDVDALQTLLARDDGAEPVEITFWYAGFQITIRSDRSMQLRGPPSES